MKPIIKIINRSNNPMPDYQTEHSAGVDLYAFLEDALPLAPLDRVLVPTGIFIALPEGYEAQIRPRSGLALKHGITVLNSPGTIDADYRGEIKVILVNLSNTGYTIQPGERICQMVVNKYEKAALIEVTDLDETKRGAGGFGHTGK